MAIIKNIVHYLAIIVYIVIAIYTLAWAPSIVGYHPLVVLTGSMEPTLKVGSIIYYEKIKEEDIKVGDIITFKKNNGSVVSHRVYSINNGEYETKGDANRIKDLESIKYSSIMGKNKSLSIVYLGYFIKFINDNPILIIVGIIILISELLLTNSKRRDINRFEGKEKENEK